MGLLFSTAHAATGAAANGAQQGNPLFSSGLMILAFVLIFYLLIWRPQSKRMKSQKNLLGSLSVGDEVTTNGGIVGKISKMEDAFVHIEIAKGVTIKLRKEAVVNILPKGSLKEESSANENNKAKS
ncbi:MAG: preprotein translocase subunit YajC [Gammaproteobacteria bacterium]|nr:preprotein translocase subunit YajC [Gammaproteobacteria bacterium]MCP4475963.1 preprotein translocase subunit YajC [Gammaproteobacteria bacterium]